MCKVKFNCRGKHPYIVAMREMGEITMYRWEHPIMTIDWIFNVFSLGKRLKKAVKVAHGQAKKVSVPFTFVTYLTFVEVDF